MDITYWLEDVPVYDFKVSIEEDAVKIESNISYFEDVFKDFQKDSRFSVSVWTTEKIVKIKNSFVDIKALANRIVEVLIGLGYSVQNNANLVIFSREDHA